MDEIYKIKIVNHIVPKIKILQDPSLLEHPPHNLKEPVMNLPARNKRKNA